ncbi:uncharacterized protein B0P05DRAFT_637466 [Gilbertella persicaria]|uniref:uncharacterized protein n=1 Tax=Gilbertella persicaria TaxID=101096 RepID=UPI00221EC605|nr:uncharacterized protein B0P05DRAFT_637466 [Gilbertella persicaria]KAI8078943.1 hypothetical protein B0P05DRAFT_637466 [Gilbertella persicaria]
MPKYKDQKLNPSTYAIIRWFGFDQLVPEHIVTSHWMSTKVFFMVRFTITLYSTIVFWIYLAILAKAGKFNGFFAAFTTLNFIGIHAYFVTTSVHHIRYLYSKNVDFLLNQFAVLNYMLLYLYSTVVTYNILTPVIFWSILVNSNGVAYPVSIEDPIVMWINLSVHGISLFMIMIDTVLNRIRIPIRMVLLVFITLVLYVLLTFIIYASTGTWEYPFLDWSQGPIAALWYFILFIVCIASFFIVILIQYVRDWIAHFVHADKEEKLQDQRPKDERISVNID